MRKDFETKCQRLLDYLWSLNQDPVIISSRKMDFKIKRIPVPIVTKNSILKRLEEVGAIKWNKESKFKPVIHLLKKSL